MKLIIPRLTPHHNMLIFSFFHYCEENKIIFDLKFDTKVSLSGGVLEVNNKIIYFDYSDSPVFADNPYKYNYYFKRSLREIDEKENVYPLNFQVNYSYKSLLFLSKLSYKQLVDKYNRIEIIRALDYFNAFTNSSHNAMDIRKFPKEIMDNGGKILFYTRLWNPDNHPDEDEKERRRQQNEFRIESCRIIKKSFKNASVGLFPDNLSLNIATDILLNKKKTSKKEYFGLLKQFDIGIADDGLKDTPGWKIGEYLLFGKAVVTTPLNVSIENFHEHINYEKLSTRNSFNEVPEKIEYLLSGNKYLEVGKNNLDWSYNYLHPKNFIQRILSKTLGDIIIK
jgi:hypothetical protein